MWDDNLEDEEYERMIYDYDFSEFSTGRYSNSHSSGKKSNREYDENDDLTASDSIDD